MSSICKTLPMDTDRAWVKGIGKGTDTDTRNETESTRPVDTDSKYLKEEMGRYPT